MTHKSQTRNQRVGELSLGMTEARATSYCDLTTQPSSGGRRKRGSRNVFAASHDGSRSRFGAKRFNCGVRRCRSNVVARCRRTFTSEVLIPSAAAASLILSSLHLLKQIDC